jgi:dihydrofolate reductase
MGHPIIMGRKTFQSFPKGPLPGRRNIIVSRDSAFTAPGAEVYTSLTDAITAAAATSPRAFIIGGGQLYRQAIGLADNLLLTVIETHRPDADTFFPDIDPATWIETDHGTPSIDPRSGLSFRFACLSRR